MESVEKEINIHLDKLEEYTIENGKNYQYINFDTLNFDIKNKIIDILENTNEMPNNFLKFVYVVNVNNLREIYLSQKNAKDELNKDKYTEDINISNAYHEKKFGLLIKINADNKSEQQIVFYCMKNQSLYEQFFLKNNLNTKNYFDDVEISLSSSSRTSQNSQEKNNEININKTRENKNEKEKSKDMFALFKDEKKLDKYIKGNTFECEVNIYLRKKICMNENNLEIPNVFYTIKDITVGQGKKKTFFYNEFDSIFLVEKDVEFDKSIFKINCKYENSLFDNTKLGKSDTLKIKGKNLVFVECKIKAKFSGAFEKIFLHIHTFRSLIDDIFGTKDYGVIILYLYDNYFIYHSDDFICFQNSINSAFSNCKKLGIEGMDKFNIYAFYTYDNVYMHNYSSIQDEVDELKKEQNLMKNQIEQMQRQLELYANSNNNFNSKNIKNKN